MLENTNEDNKITTCCFIDMDSVVVFQLLIKSFAFMKYYGSNATVFNQYSSHLQIFKEPMV
jgi:hypothetical protein